MTNAASRLSDGECLFCGARVLTGRQSLVVARGQTCFVIVNLYPYNNGHIMVVPNRHVGSLTEATPAELTELMMMASRAESALTEAYSPHGMNLGLNLGRSAGAGVPGHLHFHLVPRWDGDTNFMSVVGNTRVVPEEPEVSVKRLKPLFARLVAES